MTVTSAPTIRRALGSIPGLMRWFSYCYRFILRFTKLTLVHRSTVTSIVRIYYPALDFNSGTAAPLAAQPILVKVVTSRVALGQLGLIIPLLYFALYSRFCFFTNRTRYTTDRSHVFSTATSDVATVYLVLSYLEVFMSRLNTKTPYTGPVSPMASKVVPGVTTYEGGQGVVSNEQTELFRTGVNLFFGGEKTFYEKGKDRDKR